MKITNKTLNGSYGRKYFWYIVMEFLYQFSRKEEVILENCTIQGFYVYPWECVFWLGDYIYQSLNMRKVQVLSADHAQNIPIKIKNNPHGSAGAPLSEENFRGPAGESYTLGIDMALGASDRTVVQTLTPKFCSKCDATVYLDDAMECSNCLRTFCMSHCGSGLDGKTYCKACYRLKFEK